MVSPGLRGIDRLASSSDKVVLPRLSQKVEAGPEHEWPGREKRWDRSSLGTVRWHSGLTAYPKEWKTLRNLWPEKEELRSHEIGTIQTQEGRSMQKLQSKENEVQPYSGSISLTGQIGVQGLRELSPKESEVQPRQLTFCGERPKYC